jgi:hypothetical protein
MLQCCGFAGVYLGCLIGVFRLIGRLRPHRGFDGPVNIFEGLIETAGAEPSDFDEFDRDLFTRPQNLFLHGWFGHNVILVSGFCVPGLVENDKPVSDPTGIHRFEQYRSILSGAAGDGTIRPFDASIFLITSFDTPPQIFY